MAKQIYSFTKIKKNKTKAGIISFAIGLIALALIVILMIYSVRMRGNINLQACGLGFISMVLSAFGLYLGASVQRDSDMFGTMIRPGIIINSIVLAFDIIVFFIGLFMIIG